MIRILLIIFKNAWVNVEEEDGVIPFICPIHKKGDRSNPSTIGLLFSTPDNIKSIYSILNTRLLYGR